MVGQTAGDMFDGNVRNAVGLQNSSGSLRAGQAGNASLLRITRKGAFDLKLCIQRNEQRRINPIVTETG